MSRCFNKYPKGVNIPFGVQLEECGLGYKMTIGNIEYRFTKEQVEELKTGIKKKKSFGFKIIK